MKISVGKMKKTYFLIALISITILLGFSSCKNNTTVEMPNIYVSLRHNTADNVQYLKWIVKNRSKTSSVIFKQGDILNYKIRSDNSGRGYVSDNKNKMDITLKPGETYETTLSFKDMYSGHYEASFWAKWGNGIKRAMIINFDV